MFISLKISQTSAYRVEYTLTSINKDLQTSTTMQPKNINKIWYGYQLALNHYYKAVYVCGKYLRDLRPISAQVDTKHTSGIYLLAEINVANYL